jgi:hypothetical protein
MIVIRVSAARTKQRSSVMHQLRSIKVMIQQAIRSRPEISNEVMDIQILKFPFLWAFTIILLG